MKVIFTWSELIVQNGIIEIVRYPANCNVRTELNGQRQSNEVLYTIPVSGKPTPYYPRQYPSGIFHIIDIEYTSNPEFAPVKFITDTTRKVFTWDLDREGNYWQPTGRIQEDTCYWLHHTKSPTTQGCIKIISPKNAMSLAKILEPLLRQGVRIPLEVL